jgi:hypothetical protein
MTTILLEQDVTTMEWTATYLVDGKASPEHVQYLGTHKKLPTGFAANTSGLIVYKEMQRLNPDAKVIVVI